MITVSPKAQEHVFALRNEAQLTPEYFLRVSVAGGGCSGLSYKLDFDKKDVKCHFEDYLIPNSKGDIEVFEQPLEVKGLRPKHWDSFQRCIPPHQLKKYVEKDAIAIWTVASGDIMNNEVILKGWNYCWEVEKYGEFIQTICANIWLKDPELMRPMDTLFDELMYKCMIQA